jgi:hypothetical protein
MYFTSRDINSTKNPRQILKFTTSEFTAAGGGKVCSQKRCNFFKVGKIYAVCYFVSLLAVSRAICSDPRNKQYAVLGIPILLFTLMRIRIRILPFTLMRIRILPFNLVRIRILPLPFSQIWILQCSKMIH